MTDTTKYIEAIYNSASGKNGCLSLDLDSQHWADGRLTITISVPLKGDDYIVQRTGGAMTIKETIDRLRKEDETKKLHFRCSENKECDRDFTATTIILDYLDESPIFNLIRRIEKASCDTHMNSGQEYKMCIYSCLYVKLWEEEDECPLTQELLETLINAESSQKIIEAVEKGIQSND